MRKEDVTVRSPRRGGAVAALALAAIALFGLTTASAQQDAEDRAEDRAETAQGSSDTDLVLRLDVLEDRLPAVIPPSEVLLDPDETFGTIAAEGTSTRALLTTVEADLRRLFADADDARGEVADAVVLVTTGWLDIWQGSELLAQAETHDLAFPIETFDDDGVATGADTLRGDITGGLTLILQGRERLLLGYSALRDLEVDDPLAARRFTDRAADEEQFDAEIRPLVHELLALPTTAVVAVVDRFDTDAPGLDARARAMTITCLDRDALEEAGGVARADLLGELETTTQIDCPDLPEGAEIQLAD